ncbi:hypothetical protein C8D88_116126 [Lentzea atacamensis]|uniref:Terminase small subunit n=1 Tax=Lentzea atacamensis TaxID=531938 RepID=A0A316HN20_9PSEU|nr:hypothetical protein [Lentzea atacamensis]PWK81714.1 hypothetical protein C8D88_116126 [Lentzea atacamensis]
MAGRGRAPKDPEKRVRRNADPIPTAELTTDGELRGLELPADVLGEGEEWHPQTLRWWNTWRSSPQAQTFLQTDWDFLLDTALMHHTMWAKGRWEFAAELRLRAAKFGATPEDRARLRMKVTDPDKPASDSPATKTTHYGHLKVAK